MADAFANGLHLFGGSGLRSPFLDPAFAIGRISQHDLLADQL
jgi:hypothetical protein